MQNLFSFQTPFKFLKSIYWLWRYKSWRKRNFSTLLSLKRTLSGGGGEHDSQKVLNNYPNNQSLQRNAAPLFDIFFQSKMEKANFTFHKHS